MEAFRTPRATRPSSRGSRCPGSRPPSRSRRRWASRSPLFGSSRSRGPPRRSPTTSGSRSPRRPVAHPYQRATSHSPRQGRPARCRFPGSASRLDREQRRPHVGADVVLKRDLNDFFPTFEYKRIRGTFRGLGYGEAAATIFALLTSEPEVDQVELDGQTFYVANGARRLPQGAPTSPAITNIVCRRMDARLAGAAHKLGFTYTRYADDLTFSGPRSADTGAMLDRVRFITAAEGFAEHPKKTRVLRRGRRQEVTGVVVNQQLAVDRETVRKFRALLFQIGKDGPAGKSWGASPDVFASAIGYANFVRMVDPAEGAELLARAKELAAKHGWQPKKRPPPKPPAGPAGGGAPSGRPPSPPPPEPASPDPGSPEPAKKKKWWQIF